MQIVVKDTGIGMREEHLKQLCNSFQRFDLENNQNISGLGLGLTITAHLLTRMQGELQVESVYEEGTCVTVTIPQKIADKKPFGQWTEKKFRNPEQKEVEKSIPEGLRILAVDDNKMNRMIITKLLQVFHAEVDTAENGVEAIECVTNNPKYHLILMDQMMPLMNGTEAMKKIREQRLAPNTKIVVFTADTTVGAREEYLSKGFDEYLSKPISVDALKELFQQWF